MFLVLFIAEMGEDKQSASEVRAACAGTTLFPLASLGGNLSCTVLGANASQIPDHCGSPQFSVCEGEKSFGLG